MWFDKTCGMRIILTETPDKVLVNNYLTWGNLIIFKFKMSDTSEEEEKEKTI